jgi:hypothetical protein
MDLKTELRWHVRPTGVYRLDGATVAQETERVLQYRREINVVDYGTAEHITVKKWSEWQDVPEYKEEL